MKYNSIIIEQLLNFRFCFSKKSLENEDKIMKWYHCIGCSIILIAVILVFIYLFINILKYISN